MMSATLVSAGAASSGYYKAEGYYAAGSKEAEQAATWFGRAAETMGLKGQVDDALFTQLLDGQTFHRKGDALEPGRLMGRIIDGERQHRAGLDLTFSAPKSVSVAALVYQDDRLIEAHDAAVKTAMTHVQDHLVQTRYHVNGQMKMQTGGDIIAGLFRHDTSRLLDPQLHTHAVIANQVYHPDGSTTALHNDLIFKAQKLGSEIYRNELSRAAQSLGYQVEREGKDRLIVLRDVPEELVTNFSKRRQEIETALAERKMPENAKTAELAALATRATKNQGIDRAELSNAWEKEAANLGITRDDMNQHIAQLQQRSRFHVPGQTRSGTDTPALSDARQTLATAISHISETRLHYSEVDLMTTALAFAKSAGPEELQEAYQSSLRSGELALVKIPGETQTMLTDAATLLVEKEIGTEFRRGLNRRDVHLPDYASGGRQKNIPGVTALQNRLAYTTLSEGQKDAVTMSLSETGRVVGVQGYAGTGKTFMLSHLRKEADRAGYEVRGLAPSNQAVTQLQDALPGSETLQSHLLRRGSADQPDPTKTIYVVDEASMVSNTQMRDLMRLSAEQGVARVVLVGDVQQLDSVAAGTPFAFLQKIGMPTAIMDDIQRQRNETSLSIVKHAIAGEVSAAFEKIGSNISSGENHTKAAAQHYLSLSEASRETTGLLTPTNAAREDINRHVREGLKMEGTLSDIDTVVPSLTPLRMTRAELADPSSWRTGDVAIAYQSFKSAGLVKGHSYEVLSSDRQTATVLLKDRATDEAVSLPLSQSGKATSSIELFESGNREIAIGEQVKFRISDKSSEIKNGQTATVRGLDLGYVQLEFADKSKAEISQRSLAASGMDHAYALTGHDFQGATVDRIIVAMSSNETLADQKSFYVAVSRARDDVHLNTDDAHQLADRLTKQTGQTLPALEAWLAARLERESEPQAPSSESPKPNADAERNAAKDEPQKTEKPDAEKEHEPTIQTDPKNTKTKADVLLSIATPEAREMARDLVDQMQQKQRGDFER